MRPSVNPRGVWNKVNGRDERPSHNGDGSRDVWRHVASFVSPNDYYNLDSTSRWFNGLVPDYVGIGQYRDLGFLMSGAWPRYSNMVFSQAGILPFLAQASKEKYDRVMKHVRQFKVMMDKPLKTVLPDNIQIVELELDNHEDVDAPESKWRRSSCREVDRSRIAHRIRPSSCGEGQNG